MFVLNSQNRLIPVSILVATLSACGSEPKSTSPGTDTDPVIAVQNEQVTTDTMSQFSETSNEAQTTPATAAEPTNSESTSTEPTSTEQSGTASTGLDASETNQTDSEPTDISTDTEQNPPDSGKTNDQDVTDINAKSPESPPAVGCTATASEVRKSTLHLINQVRSQGRMCGTQFFSSVPAVVWNSTLQAAALGHSNDMAQHNFFSHTGSDGSSASQRATNQGYNWITIGENIAAGQTTTEQVVHGWTDSPGHCSNLMNPLFVEIAVTCTEDNASQYRNYWTNLLGARFPD